MTALQQARAKGEAGIQSSINHAGPAWAEAAMVYIRWFARSMAWKGEFEERDGGKYFKSPGWSIEDCRLWCAAHDLPSPPDARAWGAVTRKALSEGIIVRTGGFQPTAASNGGLKALYRKA